MDGALVARVWRYLLVGTAYVLAGKLGLLLPIGQDNVTLVWAPSGIALAAVLLLGYRIWPALVAAAFIVNLTTSAPPLVAVATAIGNPAEALVGAYLLRRVGFRPALARPLDVLALIAFAAVAATTVSATVGVGSLLAAGLVTASAAPEVWVYWWLGDAGGILIVAPVILIWAVRPPMAFSLRRLLEGAVTVAAVILSTEFAFATFPMWTGYDQPLGFAVVPFLVFAGFRFGQQGGTVATLIAVLTALFVTVPAVGLVAEGTASQRLTYQSVFMIFVSTTTMLLTALIAQRSAAFEALRESNLQIERVAAERERLEAELLQASKMEAVGRLAGGVAHDFNNLLTAILGYTELVRDGVDDPTVRHDVDQIRQAATRASDLTQQLLAFARRQVVETRPLSIGTLALNLEPFLRRLIGEHIELVIGTAPDLWPVKADRGQLEQVLVNLSVNARDAMPDGGRLSIEASNLVVTPANAEDHPGVTLGELVRLTVSDTGLGIVESAREHIFEPYFTTKERGKGTGLGLATCYGIVTASGGQITVESAEGKGATFRVYLPRATEALVEDPPIAEVDVPRGSETILVVEDETLVRSVTVRSLRATGYRVLEAENGAAALELMAGLPLAQRIDLVLTDLMMPIMGGRELAARVRELRPEMAMLYVSGYSDEVLDGGSEGTGTAFLEKPFTPADLARRVRLILDQGRGLDGSDRRR